MTTDVTPAWRVQAAQETLHTAQAAFEQTVRDVIRSQSMTPSEVARALGTRNRQRIYAILGRGDDGGTPTPPSPQPVVYLRGAGCPESVWHRVREAMWARGWATVNDRTAAWHLARGGVPVVLCDFSADLDDEISAPGGGIYFGYNRYVVVGRVRARYVDTTDTVPVRDLLSIADSTAHQDESWLDIGVTIRGRDTDLPRINGGRHDMRDHVDETALALWVAQALTD